MESWKGFKLNQLGTVNRGKSKHRPRNEPSLYGGDYPFIQTGDIKAANFYITKYSQTYSDKGLKQSRLWKKGTLCITIAANIAETAILAIDACFPDSIIGFIADEKKSDVKFIKYHFDLLKIHLQSISQGTTQDNLSQEKLLRFTFTAPEDAAEQKHIASILSTYDELIETNNQRIKILEETARELYKEWFVRMRFPEYKKTKFEKGIPEGWHVKSIKDLITLKNGKEAKLSEDENAAYTVFGSNGIIGKSKSYNYKDVIIIGRVGAYCGSIEFANGLVWATDNTLVAVPDKNYENIHFCYFLLKQYDLGNFAGGAAQPLLTQGIINRLKILMPPKSLITKFDNITNPMFQQIENLKQQNTQLRQIRDRLLPRLISGNLKVKAESRELVNQ